MTDEERTRLAQERTKLARERTVLAHIRTGFAAFLFGTAIFGLFGKGLYNYIATGFILMGVIFLVTGLLSYTFSTRRTQSLIGLIPLKRKKKDTPATDDQ